MVMAQRLGTVQGKLTAIQVEWPASAWHSAEAPHAD
jgi:hypothetical protein